jgi:hypothetical protein
MAETSAAVDATQEDRELDGIQDAMEDSGGVSDDVSDNTGFCGDIWR